MFTDLVIVLLIKAIVITGGQHKVCNPWYYWIQKQCMRIAKMANFSDFFLSNASSWKWMLVYSLFICKYLLQNSTILWNFLQFSYIASKFNNTKGYPLYVGLLWLVVFVKSRLHPFKFLGVETLRLSWNIFIYHECLCQTKQNSLR